MKKLATIFLTATLAMASATTAFAFAGTATERPALTDRSGIVQARVDDYGPSYNWQKRNDRYWRGNNDRYRDRRAYWDHRRDRSDDWQRDRYRYRRSNGFFFGFGSPRW